MLKISERKTISDYYMIGITMFCLLALLLGLVSFVYDVLLLGFVFGDGVRATTLIYSFFSVVLPACFLPFLIKNIIRRRKISKV